MNMKTLMDYFKGEIKSNTLKPRTYQKTIAEKIEDKNLLCVLPTGMGKTIVGVLAAMHRLNKFPDSKVILLAPSKPLVNQNCEVFKNYLNFEHNLFQTFTGAIDSKKREELYKEKKFLFFTPQTLENDLKKNKISLENVSILIFDECHHTTGMYSYVNLAKFYLQQSKFPRILALTASPGGTKEKINEICQNLSIEEVDIKTEKDLEVKEYIQEKKIEYINVELPQKFKEIKELINSVYSDKVKTLKRFGITKPSHLINKKDLIASQIEFRKQINQGNKSAFSGISTVAQALKLSHALELLETQSINSLNKFLEKLQNEDTKAAKVITNNENIIRATSLTKNLIENNIQHPKMEKLCDIIKEELPKNPNSKIIIFANFRDTVREIVKILKNIPNAKPIELLGQKEGITQKKQIQTIKDFESGVYNCLCTSAIGEEGINIESGGIELAVFYDMVGSEIRAIQRKGRVGRTKPGRIIFILAKNSRDQAYYWSAHRKEKRMKYILKESQNKYLTEKQTELK